ncbi:MAG: translation initiation factor IF-3 [Anaerolineales bacterium]|nr:translation initiation factor IF-3 [Anaerolineales bacterium]
MFPAIDKSQSFPQRELAIGQFWEEQGIYEKTLAARADAPPFVFFEGPPTANGMPHPGHCLTRAIKDLFPRYRTMRGYRCERKAGWDTHGLPVEVEVCKELGIHSKEEIEAYGIEPFIQKCQQSVWRYMQEWERLTERLGFWVNLKDAYVTYHQSYVESVWWSLKTLFDRGQLYQGHKIVWWWAQGGTALSAGEVGQGYREVADPSVFVKFPLLDEEGEPTDTSLLVWTTTPWTLPGNVLIAVGNDIEYAVVKLEQAQDMADNEGLDLVEISPNADPPVCKVMDYGKYKYEQQKKANEARKKQKTVDVKEVKMSQRIEKNDYDVKMRNARRFLENGDKVKVSMRFRGREMAHQNIGRDLFTKMREELDELASVELEPKFEGRQMIMILAPRS